MISHFQFQSIYENQQLPGWSFSFYFQKQKFTGIYHPDGAIDWTSVVPQKENESSLKGQIHELMLFHVYEK